MSLKMIQEAAKRPTVTLGELQRLRTREEKIKDWTAVSVSFHKFGFYGRVGREKQGLKGGNTWHRFWGLPHAV